MELNSIGLIVRDEWERTAKIRPYVELDIYQIMPDHFHAVIKILDRRWGVLQYAPTGFQFKFRSPSYGLGSIIRGFKSASTKKINLLRGTHGLPVWQRNYWDRILRRHEISRVREYIRNNPSVYLDE